jgi:hypothetical protein
VTVHRLGGRIGARVDGVRLGPGAVADFDNHRREVRRVTVAGDVPVGIDGRRSRVVAGDSDAYTRIDELIG